MNSSCQDSQCFELSTLGTTRNFRKGELIYCQNQHAEYLFVLQTGRIKIERYTNDGKIVSLRIVRPGEMFGLLSVFNQTYLDNALCELDSCVLACPLTHMKKVLDCQSEMMRLFAGSILRTVHSMSHSLELRTIRSAPERVMRYLSMVRTAGQDLIELDRPYKDVAEHIGLTPEAFYRTLAKLERDGMISRSGNTIVLESSSDNGWEYMEYGINTFR